MPQDRETVRRRYAHDPGFRGKTLAGNRKWRAAHRKQARKRYVEDPHYRERILAANRKWRAGHRAELAAHRRKRYAEDLQFRKRVAAESKAFRAAHKDAHNARQRHLYATNADYRERCRAARRGARGRAAWLKARYGMTLADYDAMLAEQGGVCAICKTSYDRTLSIDHDHATNLVRGILCSNCNTGLGSFRDNPGFLRSAATFLKVLPGADAFRFRPSRQAMRGRPPKSSPNSSSKRKETT